MAYFWNSTESEGEGLIWVFYSFGIAYNSAEAKEKNYSVRCILDKAAQ